jgi:heme/copper-type cytochrome/quinol oxidase subunit 1
MSASAAVRLVIMPLIALLQTISCNMNAAGVAAIIFSVIRSHETAAIHYVAYAPPQ